MVAKLSDVAELAGVSPTTVSRVINNKGYLSEKTKQKVHEAMKTLGYKPNNLARGLQGKSPQLIGLIFPNISNIFYSELIEYLEIELFKHGYKTIICNSQNDPAKEREYIEMLEANQVDGIISSSHNLGIADYERVGAPIVAFDRNLAPNVSIVSSDNFEGGKLAAKTLQKNGCQNSIMITGNDNTDSPTGLRALGFSFQNPNGKVFKIPNNLSTIRREMEIKSTILRHKPDGIFVSDDLTAILTMKIAHQLKLNIPEDLKIIGYDGTSFVEKFFPQLTTIRQPIDEIASLIVDVLLKKMKNEKTSKDYILPISLLPGGSI
ncbi:LacI family DNA-binding transcriptional regulator [Enterococcus hirae]|uniref:LacI family DNA-binding transcriptional regulator n=1 Tax=Enterococcus sp. C63 TaxID=3231324 RepID=UPI0019DFF819|nr:LacI family DNA-binding transcriptional regulator [Enterococcus hirae]EMF0130920.1 LacI family DNA-binding transcriptional regulator [Enterococcus hirae]EMF0286522.1 LacI family DNA-binding transcriptional regulator [Enterococcus hirae]EMF0450113.1 LacI family DNA-binding transcriptional regulator [Enterococcus hirae]EMF0515354.1 LacI family DNA-binding transcriptional regulator [Enterococcus hirae]